jgi:hypothetical protein
MIPWAQLLPKEEALTDPRSRDYQRIRYWKPLSIRSAKPCWKGMISYDADIIFVNKMYPFNFHVNLKISRAHPKMGKLANRGSAPRIMPPVIGIQTRQIKRHNRRSVASRPPRVE